MCACVCFFYAGAYSNCYSTSSVGCGGSCSSYLQQRQCLSSGQLSGSSSYYLGSCSVQSCSCTGCDGSIISAGNRPSPLDEFISIDDAFVCPLCLSFSLCF